MRTIIPVLCVAAVALLSRPASACGLTPPIGPSGLPTVCRGDIPRVHAGLSVGGTSTQIDFKAVNGRLLQGASVVAVDVNPFVNTPVEPLTLSLSGGASLGGRLDVGDDSYVLRPGYLVGAGLSYRFGGRGALPFVQPAFSASYANGTAVTPAGSRASFREVDYRFGLAIGKTIGRFAAPFAVARYFGGGTTFQPLGGHAADHFRYHVGVGSAFAITDRVDAVAEIAFLGERRATVGFGYSF